MNDLVDQLAVEAVPSGADSPGAHGPGRGHFVRNVSRTSPRDEAPTVPTAHARPALLQSRYMRRVTLLLSAVLTSSLLPFVSIGTPSVSAQAPVVSVIIDGTGNGHGRGPASTALTAGPLAGQNHGQILDAYFGGTIPEIRGRTQRLDVRLLGLDNVPNLTVVAPAGGLVVTGVGGSWGAVYAAKVGVPNANSFQLWGSAVATDCNADPAGLTPLGTFTTPVVEFTLAGGDDPNTPAQNTLGVCRPDGSVVHYRGTVEFWDTSAGTRVANSVLVEQYLRGVVPREVPASWVRQDRSSMACRTGYRRSRPRPSRPGPTVSPRIATIPSAPPVARRMRPRATRRRVRSTGAPRGGRAARRRSSRCSKRTDRSGDRTDRRRGPATFAERTTGLHRVLVVQRSVEPPAEPSPPSTTPSTQRRATSSTAGLGSSTPTHLRRHTDLARSSRRRWWTSTMATTASGTTTSS